MPAVIQTELHVNPQENIQVETHPNLPRLRRMSNMFGDRDAFADLIVGRMQRLLRDKLGKGGLTIGAVGDIVRVLLSYTHADHNFVWPSITRIAETCYYGTSAVSRGMSFLRDEDLIVAVDASVLQGLGPHSTKGAPLRRTPTTSIYDLSNIAVLVPKPLLLLQSPLPEMFPDPYSASPSASTEAKV